jgi:NAD(P)-dependent dehydrogenase (short-subunit alcohol dehydrogenase family)
VALVTGGARGVGLEVARAFAREGAQVVIADLGTALDGRGRDDGPVADAAAGIRAEGGVCEGIAADVGDPKASRALVTAALDSFGRVDILVNAAGILRRGSLLDLDPDDWSATLRVHLDGALYTTCAVVAHWAETERAGRRIVNISSDSGLYGDASYVAYAVAKAGVVALTLSCAEVVEPLGGTANVFIPQAATRMTNDIPLEELPDRDRWAAGEFDPAHVPPALLYLVSEEADWITGHIVGGWGFEVHLYSKPARARSIFSPGPWDLDALFSRFRTAFEAGDAST